jgi:hypothetical protein
VRHRERYTIGNKLFREKPKVKLNFSQAYLKNIQFYDAQKMENVYKKWYATTVLL